MKKIYNSYVVNGKKTALIEGASDNISEDIIKSASFAVFTRALSATGIERILDLNPDIEIVGTVACVKNLKEITNRTFNEHIAKDGAELELGGRTLKFTAAPHLNSPDTMMIYDKTDRALFSGLAFGSYADGDLRAFYNHELSRFKPFVKTAAERALSLGVDIILPSVGAAIKENARNVIDDYIKWSVPQSDSEKKATVFYASSSGNTAQMADVIKDVMTKSGVEVKCFDALNCDKNEMLEAFYGADMLAFGSPTVHRNAAKPIWDIISNADLVNMKHKPCMVFGSYGWGGEGIQYLHNHLKLLRFKPFEKPFGCLFTPSEKNLADLEQYTKKFLESINEI